MKPKVFIIVGWLSVPKEIVYEIFNERYGYCKCWFVSKEHYLQSRFSYANTTGKKIAAIFVGPVPHKSFAAGKHSSMVTELCIANSLTPVYVCRNKSGILKFTKSSLRQAIITHEKHLQQQQNNEDRAFIEFKQFITELFPNQTLF